MLRTVGSALRLIAAAGLAILFAAPAGSAATRARTATPPDSAAVMKLLADVANPTCPVPGVATGGQITRNHLRGLSRSGFRTVLDLRGPDEPRGYGEAGEAKRAGLDYVLLPITGATLDDLAFDKVRALMNDGKRHPVMVHCASGNRVGVVLLPWLVLDRGWKLPDAVAIAERGGMRATPMRDLALDYIDRKLAER